MNSVIPKLRRNSSYGSGSPGLPDLLNKEIDQDVYIVASDKETTDLKNYAILMAIITHPDLSNNLSAAQIKKISIFLRRILGVDANIASAYDVVVTIKKRNKK